MVVVAVTDDERLDTRQFFAELACIGDQGLALAGIEQVGTPGRFQVTGKAVLAKEPKRLGYGVFTENCQTNCHGSPYTLSFYMKCCFFFVRCAALAPLGS
jgi:hypothetical protein